MGWGATIGVVFLTTIAGGGAAFGLANFFIYWQQMTSREGAAGYFAVFVTATGIVSGFIVGLLTVLIVRSGFLRAQGLALAIVLGLTAVATVLPFVLDDPGPKIDGDKLLVEVELKCPRGWVPDHRARAEPGSFCWIQEQSADALREVNPIVSGDLFLKTAPEPDGQWLVTCGVPLAKSRKDRFLRVFVGQKTDVTIRVPLPSKPGVAFKAWSQWTSEGFLPQKDKPAATDYVYRYRVQGEKEYALAHPDPAIAFQEARQKALAAVTLNAPLVKWLPFFENERGHPTNYAPGVYPEVEALKARVAELGPLLRSQDRTIARRAIFATTILEQTPASLVEPLAAAGKLAIELVKEARAGALPGDPDLPAEERAWTFFFYWDQAMERAGDTGKQAHRRVLEELEPLTRTEERGGGMRMISDQVIKELQGDPR